MLRDFMYVLDLTKIYWQHGKVYILGRIIIEICLMPILTLLQVNLIQSIIDTIAMGGKNDNRP